ncbi:MAG TPA: FAD-binding protein [Halothiobacillaceae bacterium]|nr:FAD-binding protein [Halothiobacillaceae bacterium]
MSGKPDLNQLKTKLQASLKPDQIADDPASCHAYSMDNSRLHHPPHLVVFPENHEQTQTIIQAAFEHRIPVTTRGRGTGTAGGSVPVCGGIVLVTDRMNRLLEFRPEDRLARVQVGMLNSDLQKAISAAGFFWPPDPTSQALCTIGGNLGCNAAGPHAVKYGTTRENVLGLRAIDGQGQSIEVGAETTKAVVGQDFTRLLIGSEGTLAVITEAILKLTPKPEQTRLIRGLYPDMHLAAAAVSAIMAQAVLPAAVEFIDRNALNLIREHASVDIPNWAGAMLMIEVDGTGFDIDHNLKAVQNAAQKPGATLDIAHTQAEQKQLWAARKALSPTLRHIAPKKINEDVVVPVSRIPDLIAKLDQIAQQTGIAIVNFGHAGNGNIHVNLLVNPDDPAQMAQANTALDEIFRRVLALGGTLSGEHGIGYVKRKFVSLELNPATLSLMHAVKRQFDPAGILNPQKKLPDPETPVSLV